MINVLIIAGLLAGGYWAARWGGADGALAGRVAIAAVFTFTALGHFAKSGEMKHLIPAAVPQRGPITLLSGLLELVLAAAVLSETYARPAGIAISAFLIAVTPLNIYAARRRVPFGGHAAGPRYLAIRLPLQGFLLGWTYWFTLR